MINKLDYKMILQNYYNHGHTLEWLQGYLQCLYVNQLIMLTELYELSYFVFEKCNIDKF